MSEKNVEYAILQLSDLHIFDNTEWNMMQKAYAKLPLKDKIGCVVITGDLHQYADGYDKTIDFLDKISKTFQLNKNDIFIVPGNHDSEECENKDAYTCFIEKNVDLNPDCYREYFVKGKLIDAFKKYNRFVKSFYGSNIYQNPEQVQVINWKGKINFIHLNTAINCNGNNKLDQIIDINKLSDFYNILDTKIPSIILAHHSIENLHQSHRNILIRFITDLKISAYLCGDAHKVGYIPVMTYGGSGENIPCIVCGKSAPEYQDTYSDLGCVLYIKENGSDKIKVVPFEWNKTQKCFKFHNRFGNDTGFLQFSLLTPNSSVDFRKNDYLSMNESIWLPDAEKATGTQARFENFVDSEVINEFMKESPSKWGISAVKGIGKTFVLQIKRRRASKTMLCLPIGIKPNINNEWGTDSLVLLNSPNLSQLRDYNNAELLWEYCIIIYAINQLVNIEDNIEPSDVWWIGRNPASILKERIKEMYNNKEIDKQTYMFCNNADYSSLDKVINCVLVNNDWVSFAKSSLPYLSTLQKPIESTLINLKKDKIGIFIDKVDQSVRQTSSEPPEDCLNCWKHDNISTCKNENKSDEFCGNVNTACRVNCCYGCEKFETPYSDSPLRVYGDKSSYRHVNIWQYIQAGLVEAVNNLKTKFKCIVQIYFTIREEALSCEVGIWDSKRLKISGLVQGLCYSKEQQRQIYNDCIQNQQEYLLFNPSLIKKVERLEEAFIGVDLLCHPFAKNLSETVFESIYRHSFDRSRDIQIYGEYLTLHIGELRKCNNMSERGELVKKLIEEKAAELAFYFDNERVIANECYYVEKIDILPNFWANPDNFKRFIMMFSRNLMFPSEVRLICKKFNGLNACVKDCNSCSASHHPFSMLYKLGMLGKIKTFPDWQDNKKIVFLDSSQITYITGENIEHVSDGIIYLLHPALTKSIERLNVRIQHFNGFIIGKNLRVSKDTLNVLLDDKKKMSAKNFREKYFYKGFM